jgi:uncharacterized membrane protein
MKNVIGNIMTGILIVGFITACGGTQPIETPASPPTIQPATPTQAVIATDAATVVTLAAPPTEASSQASTVSYFNDVLPILQSRCFNCHGGDKTEEGLNLTTFTGIMAGSENGSVLTPGDADNSLLAEQVVSQKMPKRGPKLTPPQVQIILDWINQGALDN